MVKQTISLSIEKAIYKQYSESCREEGMIISKQVEKYMQRALEEGKKQ